MSDINVEISNNVEAIKSLSYTLNVLQDILQGAAPKSKAYAATEKAYESICELIVALSGGDE